MDWSYSTEFKNAQTERVRQLERWHRFDDIVDAMMSTKWSLQLPKPELRDGDASVERTNFSVQVGPSIADAFFNSPQGYRASYLRRANSETCIEIDAVVLERLIAKYRSTLEVRLGLIESLRHSQAKVWIKQDARVDRALKGECSSPEIEVPQWVENYDVVVPTSRGPRYLARAGVLASSGLGVIIVKGAWIKDGVPWEDAGKSDRARQIRAFGFT